MDIVCSLRQVNESYSGRIRMIDAALAVIRRALVNASLIAASVIGFR